MGEEGRREKIRVRGETESERRDESKMKGVTSRGEEDGVRAEE